MKSVVKPSKDEVSVAIGIDADRTALAPPVFSPSQADSLRRALYELQQEALNISSDAAPKRLSPELLAQVTDLRKPS